jgi:transcriptional regulator with XRE-family HTH domain
MERHKKLITFEDFLKEEFKDKEFEKGFYREVEKARISFEIAYFRKKANLTQADLAKKINTSQSAIARLENPDYQKYSISVLRKVAEAFGLELVVSLREKIASREERDEKNSRCTVQTSDDWKKYEIVSNLMKAISSIEDLQNSSEILKQIRFGFQTAFSRQSPSISMSTEVAYKRLSHGEMAEA